MRSFPVAVIAKVASTISGLDFLWVGQQIQQLLYGEIWLSLPTGLQLGAEGAGGGPIATRAPGVLEVELALRCHGSDRIWTAQLLGV
jgi:hypothetical protein